MTEAADRWRSELEAWAIPPDIMERAPACPYGFSVPIFQRRVDQGPEDTASRQRALEALPVGGSVLDVGCGAGAAGFGLVPPAAKVVGVDESADMVAAFARNAQARGVEQDGVVGRWPEAAAEAGRTDVVVCHHVLYNVPDLAAFAQALSGAAYRRVVVEMTGRHPLAPLNLLWRRFHGIDRPEGPTWRDAVAILQDMGLQVHAETWDKPSLWADMPWDELVEFVRTRLCLPATADDELAAAIQREQDRLLGPRELVTLWWDVA